jgi:hypothetical protein
LKSYDELKGAVEKWLHPDEAEEAAEGTASTQTAAPVTATAPVAAPAVATSQTVAASPVVSGNLAEEFDKFFKS